MKMDAFQRGFRPPIHMKKEYSYLRMLETLIRYIDGCEQIAVRKIWSLLMEAVLPWKLMPFSEYIRTLLAILFKIFVKKTNIKRHAVTSDQWCQDPRPKSGGQPDSRPVSSCRHMRIKMFGIHNFTVTAMSSTSLKYWCRFCVTEPSHTYGSPFFVPLSSCRPILFNGVIIVVISTSRA